MEMALTGIRRTIAVGVLLVGLSLVYKAVGWGIQDWDWDWDGQAGYFEYYGKYNYGDITSAMIDFGMAAITLGVTLLMSLVLWFVNPFDN